MMRIIWNVEKYIFQKFFDLENFSRLQENMGLTYGGIIFSRDTQTFIISKNILGFNISKKIS